MNLTRSLPLRRKVSNPTLIPAWLWTPCGFTGLSGPPLQWAVQRWAPKIVSRRAGRLN